MSIALPPRERGFTLSEVLVSLFMFGLVSSLILAVIDLETRIDGTGRDRDRDTADVVAAQTLLRHRVEQMRGMLETYGVGDTLAVQATETSFSFVAPGLESRGPHALQRFRLALSPRRELTLYTASTLGSADPRLASTEGWEALPLIGPIDWIQISYFGKDRLSGRDAWQTGWERRRELPKLVRIRLGFAAGDSRRWPVLMVRPASGVHAPCNEGDRAPECGAAS